ncbi:helix-turn-helix transcriptional regulator [Halobellus litoreus]|uniref:Helix-turn-helix transcriptional regulator n=1 Tax=Halobellus litoreus TaxID=755310 RepID=A0ABD6DZA1_9EURY|nr:MarR family transcriptional regulator [Halobellus litoreus]
MNETTLQRREIVAAGVFVTVTTVLFVLLGRLLTPSTITVTIGDTTVQSETLQLSLRRIETIVLTIAAFASGVSATTLLFESRASGTDSQTPPDTHSTADEPDHTSTKNLLDTRRQEWDETASRLTGNEQIVYEIVLNADGVLPQSDIVEQSDFSKATVSRTLDNLESKDLIERKRRGIGNMVILL